MVRRCKDSLIKFFENFRRDGLTEKEFRWAVMIVVALKMILVCMQMIQIFPGNAPVDDELMLSAAESIGTGNWLGAYSWETIAKSMGFAVWLWLLHVLHIPYLVGNQLLYAAACLFTANALRPVFRGRGSRFVVFFVLWFSPFATAQFTLRVYRDSILPAVILIVFAAVAGYCLRVREDAGVQARYALTAGLFTGFARLIRDDAIWIYPFVVCATLFYLLCALFGKEQEDRLKKTLLIPVSLIAAFAVPVIAFCAMNQKYYGVFLVNETSEPEFTAAISAMQRADTDLPHEGIAVCRDTRMKLYEAVPELAELGAYLEQDAYYNGYGWPENGEFNSGGFFWAVKRVSFESGLATDAVSARRYFRSLADAIEKAYREGRLEENKGAAVFSSFLVPYDKSFLAPTLKEIASSAECILFFEQTSSLAPLSFATTEQAKHWWGYTYTMPSYNAKAGTAEADYFFPQQIAEILFTVIRWAYRVAVYPALAVMFVCLFHALKETIQKIRTMLFSTKAMCAVLLLGVILSVFVRVVLISYIEVTNFRIGTYLLYLSGAAVLVIALSAAGAAASYEWLVRREKEKQ